MEHHHLNEPILYRLKSCKATADSFLPACTQWCMNWVNASCLPVSPGFVRAQPTMPAYTHLLNMETKLFHLAVCEVHDACLC